jgi:hypothetical protein
VLQEVRAIRVFFICIDLHFFDTCYLDCKRCHCRVLGAANWCTSMRRTRHWRRSCASGGANFGFVSEISLLNLYVATDGRVGSNLVQLHENDAALEALMCFRRCKNWDFPSFFSVLKFAIKLECNRWCGWSLVVWQPGCSLCSL